MISKMVIRCLVVGALLTAFAALQAQGGGPGRGQGRGMMMREGGGERGLALLNRKDVQDDLQITAEQKTKIDALVASARERRRKMMEEARASGDFQSMRPAMEKLEAELRKEAEAVLTSEQKARLKQIQVQLQGNRAVLDPEIQKEIGLTAEQKQKIEALQAAQREAMREAMEQVRNGEIDREQIPELMRKRGEYLDAEIGKILTEEQKTKLKEMHGKPFKAAKPGDGGA